MKILFLNRFSPLNAAARYRAFHYRPFLEEAGFRCTWRNLLPDSYIKRLYAPVRNRSVVTNIMPTLLAAYSRRIWSLIWEIPRHDLVFVQYELLPSLPFALERLLVSTRRRLVLDFDDAIYLNYAQHPNALVRRLMGEKIAHTVRGCREVIVANHTLADWASQYNKNVTHIPNAVDLLSYPNRSSTGRESLQPTIGWIGTPVTAQYLHLLAEPLREVFKHHPFTLRVIGAPQFTMPGIDVEAIPWIEEAEVSELQRCDIGIMPLRDDEWARGKSALKLIQYMASGLAAVASPVGANCDVVTSGRDGLFARTDREWIDALTTLLSQPDYRQALGQAARQTVADRYSLAITGPRFVDVLRRALLP